MDAKTTFPAATSSPRLENSAEGFATSRRPSSSITKHADFIGCTKAVFQCADDAQVRTRLPFEINHRVNQMLQHARASDRAFLGDVPHQQVATPLRLARPVSSAAHSRTCTTEPGADEYASLNNVWIESMTTTCGCRVSMW